MSGVKKKTVPRAPGPRFPEIVRAYTKGPVPDYLLIDTNTWQGDQDIPIDRYIDRKYHELEKEHLWKKVWQMACREEEIPEVGDAYVYDITDISILMVRTAPDQIKAFYNACPHQGRQLRDHDCSNTELRCHFHGFCWNLDGSFRSFPSEWDFPHLDRSKFNLAEVRVGRWGGFVFINMDAQAPSFEDYIGDMPMHWERFPLEERYIAGHVAKIMNANWKTCQETFMEAYHNLTSHSQFNVFFGAGPDSGQYDIFENYSRALGQGPATIPMAYEPTVEERLAALPWLGDPEGAERYKADPPTTLEEFRGRMHPIRKQRLRETFGDRIDELSDFEINGGGYFTLFPNFHPWWSFDEITYRFRPYKDEHEKCVMETYLLRPFQGERPKPAPIRWLDENQSHLEAPELGEMGRIFDQDEFNIPQVQKGMHTLRLHKPGLTLGLYQAGKIRHFHNLYDRYLGLETATKTGEAEASEE
jgi:phenylpropionate dioxygenase-like ring-hydroxylating dioxygenase large terminal subunit